MHTFRYERIIVVLLSNEQKKEGNLEHEKESNKRDNCAFDGRIAAAYERTGSKQHIAAG